MPSLSHFDLPCLYAQASALTQQACELLELGEIDQARQRVERRRALMRQIHQWAPAAPAWGADEAADEAALAYLAADRRLARAIDIFCR